MDAYWIAREHRNDVGKHRPGNRSGDRASRRSAAAASGERRGRLVQQRQPGRPQGRRMSGCLVEEPGPAEEQPVACQQPVCRIRQGRGQGGPGCGAGPHDPPPRLPSARRRHPPQDPGHLLLHRRGHLQQVRCRHRRRMPRPVQAGEHGAPDLRVYDRVRRRFGRDLQLHRHRQLPALVPLPRQLPDNLQNLPNHRPVPRARQRAQLRRPAAKRALQRRSARYGQGVGARRDFHRRLPAVPGLQGVPDPDAAGAGEDRLCHLGRHGPGGVGLRGDLGHADLQAGRDGQDRLRAGDRRRPCRGHGAADADAVQPAPGVAGAPGGRDRDGVDRQRRPDAESVDRTLRAHRGGSGAGCGGGPDADRAGPRRRGAPRRAEDRHWATVRDMAG